MAIRSLLIANRGEIAVRIIRAAREMGIRTVQAHSQADADSLAVRLADKAVEIGPAHAARSYLNVSAILRAAQESGADAVHPGYGFLAENADFADAVEAAGLTFVGPRGHSIRLMGDKVAARIVARGAGVATVPGSEGRIDGVDEVVSIAERIGYPVMIKAAAGGGGRGIRVAADRGDVLRLVPQASAEAKAAFGDGGLYLEKIIARARHIEVQILGDGTDIVHCYERDCSLQRRRQKVWEEAPSVSLTQEVRERLCGAAAALARGVHYRGAGTIEFLYDEDSQQFYFLEMNTRIQVEHPVSELVTGVDLVREMLSIAGGEKLRLGQDDIRISGHAIEVRINAEDPENNFMPSPGTVSHIQVPGGPGVRFDTLLYSGYSIPPFYDSLVGKLIVWDENRTCAIERLRGALGELEIAGVKTTKPLHQALAAEDDVRAGRFDTRWLERWLERHPQRLAQPWAR
jgi:acetyl-CoA carboxylase biotin carboxylase subunit